MIYFSKSTGGFYNTDLYAGSLPADAVEIAQQTRDTLLAGIRVGQVVSADPNGNPIVVDASTLLTLTQLQARQRAILSESYQTAIEQPVTYTSKGGVTKTYQAGAGSVANLSQMLLAFGASEAVPTGFYWVSLDNTQVPFTYADMQALAAAFGAQGAAAFQQLQSLKAQVNAATTASAVQAVVWP